MDRELAIELLREIAFTATESYRQALETAINALSVDVRENRTSEDCISRQAVLEAIQKLNIPEDMCVFEIISHIEVAIATLPSVENKGELCDDYISRKDAIQALKAEGLEEMFKSLGVYPWNVIKMIPSVQPKKGEWIPVSERPPKNNVRVLCSAISTSISGGYTQFVGCCNNGFWFVQTDAETVSYPRQYNVTAWMPLPEPYKADKRSKIRCNTCKNNDDELSGECYECLKGIFDHYEPQESEDK